MTSLHGTALRTPSHWLVRFVEIDEPATGWARLELPGGAAWYRYEDPSTLAQIAITVDDNGQMTTAGRPFARALLGPASTDTLNASVEADREIVVEEALPSWAPSGRLALLVASLTERHRPIEGLWALEAYGLLHDADLLAAAGPVADDWLAEIGPIVGSLDPRWLASVDPRAAAGISASFAEAVGADPALAATPLGRAILAGIGDDRFHLAARGGHDDSDESSRGFDQADMPAAMLGLGSDRREATVFGQIDFTADGVVETLACTLEGGVLAVDVTPAMDGEALMSDVELRVFMDHRLVGAAIRLHCDDGWTAELTMPPGAEAGQLRVVAGRVLNDADFTMRNQNDDEFTDRQLRHHLRRASDALRVGDHEDADHHLARASRAINGVVGLEVTATGRFDTEVAAASPLTQSQVARLARDRTSRAAARHLALISGDLVQAALITIDDLQDIGRPPRRGLTLTLIKALIDAGLVEEATQLQDLCRVEQPERPDG